MVHSKLVLQRVGMSGMGSSGPGYIIKLNGGRAIRSFRQLDRVS